MEEQPIGKRKPGRPKKIHQQPTNAPTPAPAPMPAQRSIRLPASAFASPTGGGTRKVKAEPQEPLGALYAAPQEPPVRAKTEGEARAHKRQVWC